MIAGLEANMTDPAQKLALAQMTNDMAMIPIRLARGEDVTLLIKSLQAESMLRGLTLALKSQTAVQQAWMNVIVRIISTALVSAV
ncbi:MAG: hypothetical protein KDH96_10635 [Candidatus Riesia sp.]|nr:hypothetical protein [Candidatus Riesia sp.]